MDFQLSTCTLHTRFGKQLSLFNIISDRALVLDASLSWLAFLYQTMLLYGGYKPQRIHKGGKPKLFLLTEPRWYSNFVRAHAPEQCKRHKREQCHFNYRKRISVYQATYSAKFSRVEIFCDKQFFNISLK